MSTSALRRLNDGLVLLAIPLLPLVGVLWSDRNFDRLVQFPPLPVMPSRQRDFSWIAMAAVMIALLMLLAPWFSRRRRVDSELASALRPATASPAHSYPWWGWLALGWTLGWWALAWNRWAWFAEIQRFTFFPLWLGFILAVNGLSQRRTGRCLFRHKPGQWLALFALSAGFWWMFEWLNRFAANWHYLGVEDLGAWAYAFNATLCFSTVLPAVAAVAEWLASHPTWMMRMSRGPVWSGLEAHPAGPLLLLGGAVALVGTGRWPHLFYPALWIAPLALLLGGGLWHGRSALAGELARGDWQRAATWMLAALICGFFWEMWNSRSMAHWIYIVPGVDRWHVFAMPALGYAGYLPFGLECLLVAERFLPRIAAATPSA